MASDGAADDAFGYSIALSGNTAVVGAVAATVGGKSAAGAAYVFVRSGTMWTQQAKLTAADAAADDSFAESVAVDGDTVLVGAPYADVMGDGDRGAVYVYSRSGTTWTQQAKLAPSDGWAVIMRDSQWPRRQYRAVWRSLCGRRRAEQRRSGLRLPARRHDLVVAAEAFGQRCRQHR